MVRNSSAQLESLKVEPSNLKACYVGKCNWGGSSCILQRDFFCQSCLSTLMYLVQGVRVCSLWAGSDVYPTDLVVVSPCVCDSTTKKNSCVCLNLTEAGVGKSKPPKPKLNHFQTTQTKTEFANPRLNPISHNPLLCHPSLYLFLPSLPFAPSQRLSLGHRCPSWVPLGASWGHLGPSWGYT